MAPQWETGVMARTPSWHRLEHAVMPDWISSWDEARKLGKMEWEVEAEEVYDLKNGTAYPISGWRQIVRDDKAVGDADRVLAIQPDSYRVISMGSFGEVIDSVMGVGEGERLKFEAAFSLYGGRQIVALTYYDEPLELSWDPSATYTYVAFVSRHDGQGGLRGIPTNVRVQCANTLHAAEVTDGAAVGFTIRHTANWDARVAEVRKVMYRARLDAGAWAKFGEQLARYPVGKRQSETFLKRFLPLADDMTDREVLTIQRGRDAIRANLASPTCEGIDKNGYGLLMAATEWCDHNRVFKSDDSYVARQLLRKEGPKAKAVRIVKTMAGVN